MEKVIPFIWGVENEKREVTLAKKAIRGKEEAFVELMKINKLELYKIAYSYTKDEHKALDIIQETAYKGLLGIRKLKNPEFFKTWIIRILINTAITQTRKEANIIYVSDNNVLEGKECSTNNIEEKLDLYNAIDNLKENYKAVIILKYFENMSINEISYVLDMPSNTVKSHLKRAKEVLAKSLKEGYLDD